MIKLIVGLGNPGQQYAKTRHNAGAWYIHALAVKFNSSLNHNKKLFADLADICCINQAGQSKCYIAIPDTFMNASGKAVQALMSYYGVAPEELLIVHDELDLDPGVNKFKLGGGHGGHNGLRDIINIIGSRDFWRLRIGIGHPGHKDRVTSYVLGRADVDAQIIIDRGIENLLLYTADIVAAEFAALMTKLH
jgi:PTH1 family peptidyl-tRNA hydrolase